MICPALWYFAVGFVLALVHALGAAFGTVLVSCLVLGLAFTICSVAESGFFSVLALWLAARAALGLGCVVVIVVVVAVVEMVLVAETEALLFFVRGRIGALLETGAEETDVFFIVDGVIVVLGLVVIVEATILLFFVVGVVVLAFVLTARVVTVVSLFSANDFAWNALWLKGIMR
jgi:hypothetical protein